MTPNVFLYYLLLVDPTHIDIGDELLPLCVCLRMYVCLCVRVVLVLDEASAVIDYETDRLLRVRNH